MSAAVPVPSGPPGSRPAYWFPLALFGVFVVLPVPLYVMQLSTSPAFSGWVAYAPLSRTVSWSSARVGYSSSFSVLLQSDTGLTGIAEGWYWAAALTAGFLVTDLRSAPSALIASGGDPLRTLAETGPQTQPWEVALLPGLVLLVAAASCFVRLSRLRGQLRPG